MASSSPQLGLTVNGEARSFPSPLTVAQLLEHLGVETRQVAVERNREIVPKPDYATTPLAQDDAVEIVTFVGGG